MTDDIFGIEGSAPEGQPEPQPEIEEAFDALDQSLPAMPEGGRFITIRHEANPPVYVDLFAEEATISIRAACDRHHLTLGSNVTAYVDSVQVPLDTQVAPGQLVMLVGTVKGGA